MHMGVKCECVKARLVEKGCSQTYEIDYDETFTPVSEYGYSKGQFVVVVLCCVVKSSLLHESLLNIVFFFCFGS